MSQEQLLRERTPPSTNCVAGSNIGQAIEYASKEQGRLVIKIIKGAMDKPDMTNKQFGVLAHKVWNSIELDENDRDLDDKLIDQLDMVWKAWDFNGDGKINPQEFSEILNEFFVAEGRQIGERLKRSTKQLTEQLQTNRRKCPTENFEKPDNANESLEDVWKDVDLVKLPKLVRAFVKRRQVDELKDILFDKLVFMVDETYLDIRSKDEEAGVYGNAVERLTDVKHSAEYIQACRSLLQRRWTRKIQWSKEKYYEARVTQNDLKEFESALRILPVSKKLCQAFGFGVETYWTRLRATVFTIARLDFAYTTAPLFQLRPLNSRQCGFIDVNTPATLKNFIKFIYELLVIGKEGGLFNTIVTRSMLAHCWERVERNFVFDVIVDVINIGAMLRIAAIDATEDKSAIVAICVSFFTALYSSLFAWAEVFVTTQHHCEDSAWWLHTTGHADAASHNGARNRCQSCCRYFWLYIEALCACMCRSFFASFELFITFVTPIILVVGMVCTNIHGSGTQFFLRHPAILPTLIAFRLQTILFRLFAVRAFGEQVVPAYKTLSHTSSTKFAFFILFNIWNSFLVYCSIPVQVYDGQAGETEYQTWTEQLFMKFAFMFRMDVSGDYDLGDMQNTNQYLTKTVTNGTTTWDLNNAPLSDFNYMVIAIYMVCTCIINIGFFNIFIGLWSNTYNDLYDVRTELYEEFRAVYIYKYLCAFSLRASLRRQFWKRCGCCGESSNAPTNNTDTDAGDYIWLAYNRASYSDNFSPKSNSFGEKSPHDQLQEALSEINEKLQASSQSAADVEAVREKERQAYERGVQTGKDQQEQAVRKAEAQVTELHKELAKEQLKSSQAAQRAPPTATLGPGGSAAASS